MTAEAKAIYEATRESGPYRRVELTYELFQRWFPQVPEQARGIKRSEARRVLVQRYLDNVVATDRNMVAKVFHVFKWTSSARIIPRQDRADK
jgi:hypothetical protein